MTRESASSRRPVGVASTACGLRLIRDVPRCLDSCAACIRLLAHRGRSGGLGMAAARPRDRPARRDKCIYGSDTCDSRQDSSLEHRLLLCRSVLLRQRRAGLGWSGFLRVLHRLTVRLLRARSSGVMPPCRNALGSCLELDARGGVPRSPRPRKPSRGGAVLHGSCPRRRVGPAERCLATGRVGQPISSRLGKGRAT